MSLRSLLVHDVTVVVASTATDGNGFTKKTWTTGDTLRGWITQQSSTEVLDGREAQVSSWVLFVETAATVEGVDRVTWDGLTFEVDGTPRRAWTPRGEHHVEVPLRVVDG